MKTYEVTAERDGKFWFVRIPEIDGATQGRTLSEVPEMARDYIALVTGIPEGSFDVAVQVLLPTDAKQHISRAALLREEEARARTEAAAEVRAAARSLHSNGYSMREIGEAMAISRQRAQQLVST